MKKKTLTVLSVLLLIFVACAGFVIAVQKNNERSNLTDETVAKSKYDCVYFGSYPQSEVTDKKTLKTLPGADEIEWKSYGYYIGDGSCGSMEKSDYMKYADVSLNEERYRAVVFSKYRPEITYKESKHEYSSQPNNGYDPGKIYWFKYEPLKWRILDKNNGLVLSEYIIDSQAYSNTVFTNGTGNDLNDEYWNDEAHKNYSSDYYTSSVRNWLNEDFYNTAFNNEEKSKIETTVLDNSAYSIESEKYDSKDSNDKIFLLSYSDVINKNYGFDSDPHSRDIARRTNGTDYAKIQGLLFDSASAAAKNIFTSEKKVPSGWWLRSAREYSASAANVSSNGLAINYSESGLTALTDVGIRPALNFVAGYDMFSKSAESK